MECAFRSKNSEDDPAFCLVITQSNTKTSTLSDQGPRSICYPTSPPKENSKQNKKNTHTQTKKPSGADSKQKMRENWTAVCADTDYYNKTESLEECRWMVLVFVIIKKKKTQKNHKIKN